MASDMSRVKYNKTKTDNKSNEIGTRGWKEQRIAQMEAANPWDNGGVKQYRELKPNAVFDISEALNLTK